MPSLVISLSISITRSWSEVITGPPASQLVELYISLCATLVLVLLLDSWIVLKGTINQAFDAVAPKLMMCF